MKSEDFERLVVNANRFYLEKDKNPEIPVISDKEYDQLRNQFELENPGKSVKYDLVEWDEDVARIHEPMEPLSKIVVENQDMRSSIEDFIKGKSKYRINYKYDGSSIKAYYDEQGRLRKIMGTPDEEYGFDRTKSFMNLFPQKVSKGIKSIQGEVLVSTKDYGELARNKANGLTNSKYCKEEVESTAFIRAYSISFYDGDKTFERETEALSSLPIIYSKVDDQNKLRPVFRVAEQLSVEDIPFTSLVTSPSGDDIQVDGVVVYTEDGVQGFKFYYTESKDVKITDIEWNYRSDNGSFTPVAIFDTITLNGKSISRCSLGGVPNMMYLGAGIGAEVKVILANMTIPKIIEVYKRSENYAFPSCECGYQLSEKDIYGSNLKCGNTGVCSCRLEARVEEVKSWIPEDNPNISLIDLLAKEPMMPIYLLKIDRFNPESKFCKDHKFNDESDNKMYDYLWYKDTTSEFGRNDAISCLCSFYEISDKKAEEILDQLHQIREMYDQDGEIATNAFNDLKSSLRIKEDLTENYINDILYDLMCGTKLTLDLTFRKWFNYSDLQLANARLNYATTIEAFRKVFKI